MCKINIINKEEFKKNHTRTYISWLKIGYSNPHRQWDFPLDDEQLEWSFLTTIYIFLASLGL